MFELNHLKLSRKFLVLGLIALVMVAVPTLLHVGKSLEDIGIAQQEERGMAPLMAMQKVVRFMQQHRGLSSGMLSGNAAMKDRRPPVKANVDKAIAEVDAALVEAGASDTLQQEWGKRKKLWAQLEPAVAAAQLSAAESTKLHTQMIGSVLHLNDEVLDEFGLMLDAQMATHDLIQASFVKAPWLTEKLGIMRAMGSGFLTQGQLPPEGKGKLGALKDRVQELHYEMNVLLEHATSENTAFKSALSQSSQGLKQQVEGTLTLVDQQLINAPELTYPATQYFDELTRTIDAVYQFNDGALEVLRQALHDRVARLYQSVAMVLGLQLVGLLAAVWLSAVFVRSITRPIDQAVKLAHAVSQGDLTADCPAHGSNEIGKLMDALASMQKRLRELVATVRSDAEAVATASSQILQGTNDLSARTEQSASALEQTAASMEQLNEHVRLNADHAREADQVTHQARSIAVQGGTVVAEVVHTMREINASSTKISDIIGVIDSIAFQTNILALNAAVEAARAGEQGRGFAVVASEVRSLAGRSAEAAKEIKALISDSVDRVQQGTVLVDKAGQTMEEVVGAIKRVTDLMTDISAASSAQSVSVTEVGQAVNQLDQSTQQNAALVEEAAAACESLRQQAHVLVSAVSSFKT